MGPDENGRVRREKSEVISKTKTEVSRMALVVGIVESCEYQSPM